MSATLSFDDEFNSLNLWNGSTGTWSTTFIFADPNGNGSSLPSNGEQEWYINNLYAPTSSVTPWKVSNGVLTLTAQPTDPSIAQYLGYTQAGLPAMGSYQYTSGLIETSHSFNQTYGYFEMKAELPAGQGLWPAFWLLPQNGSWPPELDVMEVLGNAPGTLYTTVHTDQTGTATSSGIGSVVANTSTAFHTYGVDWEADKITWYFDDKPVYQVATPADMHSPMYMLANLAVGGSWPGNADATTPFPAQMNIDYIKAWTANPYSYAPETSTGAGQTIAGAANDSLTGTSGDDTFVASLQGGEMLTGGTGHDTYVFGSLPWNPDKITDFQIGSDKLDLHALYPTYAGADPIADGYVSLSADGHGGFNVFVNPDGHATTANPWPTFIVDLPGVTSVGLTSANLLVNGSLGQTAASTFSTADTFQATGTLGQTTASAPPPPPTPITNVEPFTLPLSQAPVDTISSSHTAVLTGTPKNDLLDGHGAYHSMAGGAGDDTYAVYVSTDTVTEKVGAGTDTVRSYASSYSLAANVENGVLTGTTREALTGNSLNNDLRSNNAGSVLNGGAGNDILHAGTGADTLTGGAGKDVFEFSHIPPTAGQVTDFTHGSDVLDLRGLFASVAYKGVNPIADGYLSLHDDGQGNTQVLFDADGTGTAAAPTVITTLDHVLSSSLTPGSDWVFG